MYLAEPLLATVRTTSRPRRLPTSTAAGCTTVHVTVATYPGKPAGRVSVTERDVHGRPLTVTARTEASYTTAATASF